ncbi:hypothetical protein ABK040_008571 [Willaertia magna]
MLRGLAATAYRHINEVLMLNKSVLPKAFQPSILEEALQHAPTKRGEFNVYEVFKVENPWTKYMEIPSADLALWEKVDKTLVLSYRKAMRYEQFGLLYDDLLNDEDPVIIEALNRVPEEVLRAREKRLARAFDLSVNQKRLPKEEWTKPEDDVAYLRPYVVWVRCEMEEYDAQTMLRDDYVPFFKVTSDDYETGKAFTQRYVD